VRPDQGGVQIHDQRLVGIGSVVGGVRTGQRPHSGTRGGAGRIDRGHGRVGVDGDGERINEAGDGRSEATTP
jgi:hypothetical protein